MTHVVDALMQAPGVIEHHAALETAERVSVLLSGPLHPDSEFDVRLAVAAQLIARLRAQVLTSLDFTVSAGALPACVATTWTALAYKCRAALRCSIGEQ